MKARPSVGVILLNYFKAERVVEGLCTFQQQTIRKNLSIVVVDNSADERQSEILKSAFETYDSLFLNTVNLGYARGINQGSQSLKDCDYYLLANPDIILDKSDTLERLVDQMEENPNIAVLSPMQVNDDGTVVEVARNFPSLFGQLVRRIFPYRNDEMFLLGGLSSAETIAVDWVQSSFSMIRGNFWRRIGGLDERYFVFMSDVELGKSAEALGLDVVVTRNSTVRADGLRASRGGVLSIFGNKVLRIHLRDALTYHLRHGTFFKSDSLN